MTWKSPLEPWTQRGAAAVLLDENGGVIEALYWDCSRGTYTDRDGHRLHPNFNKAKEMCEKAATRG